MYRRLPLSLLVVATIAVGIASFTFVLGWFVFAPSSIFAEEEIPSRNGHVTDVANVMKLEGEKAVELEKKLNNVQLKTAIDVSVLIIPSLKGRIGDEYAKNVIQEWQLGGNDENGWVFILIAKNELGSWVRSNALTDLEIGSVNKSIQYRIGPTMTRYNYDFRQGVIDGLHEVTKIISLKSDLTAADRKLINIDKAPGLIPMSGMIMFGVIGAIAAAVFLGIIAVIASSK